MAKSFPFIRYVKETYPADEVLSRSKKFHAWLEKRRTVRDFSIQPIAPEVIDELIMSASTAPSGAHKQPWTFCIVTSKWIKKQIRDAAEAEEYESYHGRMNKEWLQDLEPLGTDWRKPFLEVAPVLIVVFKRIFEFMPDGSKRQNYYVQESVGIACGLLLAAIHDAGLVALTHTPSPMNFLSKILDRPENEKPFLLIPIGYPAKETLVPDLKRKSIEEVRVNYT